MHAELACNFNTDILTQRPKIAQLLTGRHHYPNLDALATAFRSTTAEKIWFDGAELPEDVVVGRRAFMAQESSEKLPITAKLGMNFQEVKARTETEQDLLIARGFIWLYRLTPEELIAAQGSTSSDWFRNYSSIDVLEPNGQSRGSITVDNERIQLTICEPSLKALNPAEFAWLVTQFETNLTLAKLGFTLEKNGQA